MSCIRLKNEYTASTLIIILLATVTLIPLKSADAQVLPRTTVGEVLTDGAKQKIANLKTNHPELGALADKLQTMNVTQVTNEIAALLDFGQTMLIAVNNLQGNMTAAPAQEKEPVLEVRPTNQTETASIDAKGQRIASLLNILGISMIEGININGINVGDTDVSITLSGEQNQAIGGSTSTTGTTNMSSLPVTVIVSKLPIGNLSELMPLVESSRSLATVLRGGGARDTVTGQQGSDAGTERDTLQLLSMLRNVQVGTGNIVNTNWSQPQTISMGLLGMGNRGAPTSSNEIVVVIVVPFIGDTPLSAVPLR